MQAENDQRESFCEFKAVRQSKDKQGSRIHIWIGLLYIKIFK